MTVAALRELQAVAARVASALALTTGICNAVADDVMEIADVVLAHHEGGR